MINDHVVVLASAATVPPSHARARKCGAAAKRAFALSIHAYIV